MSTKPGGLLLAILFMATAPRAGGASAEHPAALAVRVVRVPEGGIQPQAVVDDRGTFHLIYYRGDDARGDVYYVTSKNRGQTFSSPLQVNSRPGSAIAIGNIRGAHLAIGKYGRAHVAWMGTDRSPPGPERAIPMVYTRLNDAGTAFEPERNVLQHAAGFDGGGSVAADAQGNVYVAWHAAAPGGRNELQRTIWIAKSADEGRTFGRETRATTEQTGACGCCGMRAFCDSSGRLYVLFRGATKTDQRDMVLLLSDDQGRQFRAVNIHPWAINGCPMSSASFVEGPRGVLAAWETKEQVYFAPVDIRSGSVGQPIAPAGEDKPRKYPTLAAAPDGRVLLAWTEGMGWKHGGRICWQVFDEHGQPLSEQERIEGVPTWSVVAAAAFADGTLAVIY